jgi:hypothetical protein
LKCILNFNNDSFFDLGLQSHESEFSISFPKYPEHFIS